LHYSSSPHAGFLPKPATACKETAMDFIIAGITAVLLFGYLIYALLRPEKF
jgi:K+-transporting ATPase KdpF subunit